VNESFRFFFGAGMKRCQAGKLLFSGRCFPDELPFGFMPPGSGAQTAVLVINESS
jgi:hypothetical protein